MAGINDFNKYQIKRETMTSIANRLRVLVGKSTPLTPEEIVYWLERVIFTPQTHANSNNKLGVYSSNIRSEIPTVNIGFATSRTSTRFTSTADVDTSDI